jgi:hypothetical protein
LYCLIAPLLPEASFDKALPIAVDAVLTLSLGSIIIVLIG